MKLHALQYLRAIAALAVVYSHIVLQVASYQQVLPDFGGFGVDIFFVISGFIMVYIARPGDTPIKFIKNRVRRVVPLYWFFTLAMALILLLAPSLFKSSTFDIPVILKSLFFIPHYSLAAPSMLWPIVAPGWSLNYEMYFYLLFAASLVIAQKWRILMIGMIITIIFVVAWLTPTSGAVSSFYRDTIVFEFVLGMLLARAYQLGFTVSVRVSFAFILAGFALLFAELPFARIFSFGIPSLMIVAGTVYCRLPSQSFLVMLGDSSYALYLCHIFTLGLCRIILPPLLGDDVFAAWMFVIISLIVCIGSGIAVHYLIDNWLLRRERLDSLRGVLSGTTAPLP